VQKVYTTEGTGTVNVLQHATCDTCSFTCLCMYTQQVHSN